MTHQDYKRLLNYVLDNVVKVNSYCELLEMALQQLDNPDDKTLDRVSILIEVFLEKSKPYLDTSDVKCKTIDQNVR